MRYRDLIQFDPIETVVQLRSANDMDAATRLVSTYVISDHMRERLIDRVIPQLAYDEPADQKGLLIVGNYGTGKSHLLALLSAVTERADIVKHVRSEAVSQAMKGIAGRFKVIRLEIGATQMPLRDIVIGEIEDALADWGIEYEFPTMMETSNTKDPIIDMMIEFQKVFPDLGLLLVVDELLDYLRSRDEQALILDLGFLREVGEVCRDTRLRFIGGVQESLFDSPTFQFVASAIGRVKDRFEQVRIAREDVAFVVSERLLRKSVGQKEEIRTYLDHFTHLFPELVERRERYVDLFPVHPAYIDTFEEIHLIEKREVLKTVSREMSQRLDDELPTDRPGLIAYDTYWHRLRSDPGFRTIPEVREVVDRSAELAAKIESGFTRPQYKSLALQIIDALSVQRLTVLDLRSPIGVTPEELRDDLCLYIDIPEKDPEFLSQTIETTLREISRTVSGSYLSRNPDNGQWFLDLDKDIDYDALIDQRSTIVPDSVRDRYFYNILSRLMEVALDNSHISGHRIWEYEVEWPQRRVTRPGYLFFGSPNQRSTAQPPREFYLYFLAPYDPAAFADENLPDEVFFRLRARDAQFDEWMRLFSGAMMLAETATTEKQVYLDKAMSTDFNRPGYMQHIIDWLRENALTSIEVVYRGRVTPASELVTGSVGSFKDLIDQIAASCLSGHFNETLLSYPTFPILITRQNLGRTAAEAIRGIVGPMRSQQAIAVLSALELLDGDKITIDRSRYARHIREELQERGEGKVLNRTDLIESMYGGRVEFDRRFHLEPEWLSVVLVAMAYSGVITIQIPGGRIDAGSIDDAAKIPIDTLVRFQHVGVPRQASTAALMSLFSTLDLTPGLIADPNAHDAAVKQLQKKLEDELARVVTLRQKIASGMPCWNATVIEGTNQSDVLRRVDDLRQFLDSLLPINTAGKLKSFRNSEDEVRSRLEPLRDVRHLAQLEATINDLQPIASYLVQARSYLGDDDPLSARIRELQDQQLDTLRELASDGGTVPREQLVREAQKVKAQYTTDYISRHNRARLNVEQYRRKVSALESASIWRLRALRSISILVGSSLNELEAQLTSLKACTGVSPTDIATDPLCPHCAFRPDESLANDPAVGRLEALRNRIDAVEQEWTSTLVANLQDPTVQSSLGLLGVEEHRIVEQLLQTNQLPSEIDQTFLKAMSDAFTGLERVAVSKDDLIAALTNGGAPGTIAVLTDRFTNVLTERAKGKDPTRVRIVIE